MARNELRLIPVSMLVCIFLQLQFAEAAPQLSLVRSLPGFKGAFPSKHYSGYVTLEGSPPKNLFYYFVVSERSPALDPVVLWLNGGPGCSSFDGFVYEHGPFNFEASKAGGLPVLHLNPYSWSKVASIIYLDSPVGVGFSYSANTSYYVNGDLQTADETHQFLLKGYMVGNGVCDSHFDGNALVPFAHGMGLISDMMHKEAEAVCGGNYHNPLSIDCQNILYKIDSALEGLNRYDILEPCFHRGAENDSTTSLIPESFKQLGVATERPLAVRKRIFGRAWPFRAPVADGVIPMWPQLMREVTVPCIDDVQATKWLNDKGVRKAIHADPESGHWSLCKDLHYTHDAGSMIAYHKNLTLAGYRALIYSGDHDMCVPFTGTQAWTQSLGYDIVEEWRPWKSNAQIAGCRYVQEYANDFTFLTVKGAGHTVPEYKPRESLHFFSSWLEGKKI
ncbi:serine carboxypeptidase-like 20 isoform X3 [Salvia splendens]|uniref:serine carboxypeptidase-like 20 isoform X3 n=1 Tax=Salvia splendens TaxID=180675 RepID=UPI001C27D0E5|nr:serine carboxypeptidase-like 20 isoform X3 [Salvia splendens]